MATSLGLLGTKVGLTMGIRVGVVAGTSEGVILGLFVGLKVGTKVGAQVGFTKGTLVGIMVGAVLGLQVVRLVTNNDITDHWRKTRRYGWSKSRCQNLLYSKVLILASCFDKLINLRALSSR